jgi:hypothetical protein
MNWIVRTQDKGHICHICDYSKKSQIDIFTHSDYISICDGCLRIMLERLDKQEV